MRIHSILDITFNANIVYNTCFQKFYVSFERGTIKNDVPASYSVSLLKYAARRLLTELFGILNKVEQHELRQAKEQYNASAYATGSTDFDMLEPNKDQQAAVRGGASGGYGLLRLGKVCALVKQLKEEMSPNLLDTNLQQMARVRDASKERLESAPRAGG